MARDGQAYTWDGFTEWYQYEETRDRIWRGAPIASQISQISQISKTSRSRAPEPARVTHEPKPGASRSPVAEPAPATSCMMLPGWRWDAVMRAGSKQGVPFEIFHRVGPVPKWSMTSHFGCCDQSCGCCRWRVCAEYGEPTLGNCVMCEEAAMMQCAHRPIACVAQVDYVPLLCFLQRKLQQAGRELFKQVFAFLGRGTLLWLTVVGGLSGLRIAQIAPPFARLRLTSATRYIRG